MEPHGLKPVVSGLPRLALRNRISDFKGKVPEISKKFLGIRYGEILFDNFAILVWVIRRHVSSAESAVAPRLFAAFIHGLKSRGILRRRIKNDSIPPFWVPMPAVFDLPHDLIDGFSR